MRPARSTLGILPCDFGFNTYRCASRALSVYVPARLGARNSLPRVKPMREKVVLAYSGGLDTSVAIRWLQENYGMDVITLTADVGNEKDIVAIRDKALTIGAVKAAIVDARDLFVHYFVFP